MRILILILSFKYGAKRLNGLAVTSFAVLSFCTQFEQKLWCIQNVYYICFKVRLLPIRHSNSKRQHILQTFLASECRQRWNYQCSHKMWPKKNVHKFWTTLFHGFRVVQNGRFKVFWPIFGVLIILTPKVVGSKWFFS